MRHGLLLLSGALLLVAHAPLQGQEGLVTGVVVEVRPGTAGSGTNLPVQLHSGGTSRSLGTTGPTGTVTVPYTSAVRLQTAMIVALISATTGPGRLVMFPEGETPEECETSQSGATTEEERCQELGAFVWGVTRHLYITLSQVATMVVLGSLPGIPSAGTWSVGPMVGRNLEWEAFMLGAALTSYFTGPWPQLPLTASGGLWTTRVSNASLWSLSTTVGLLLPTAAFLAVVPHLQGGLIASRYSSSLGSANAATEFGLAFQAGVLATLQAWVITTHLGLQRVQGQTQPMFSVSTQRLLGR